jgi:Domain of unknown function (DUF2357)
MQYYPSLFAYLNQAGAESTRLQCRDRPILQLSQPLEEPLLMPIASRSGHLYEAAFAYLKPEDFQEGNHPLEQSHELELSGQRWTLFFNDEIIDRHAVDEDQLELWDTYLDKEDDIYQSLLVCMGLWNNALREPRRPQVLLMQLPERLKQFDLEAARQPLIMSLEEQFQLRNKLEVIASKLRSQLNRRAELMPVGRIQEMDAYCLRNYVRRPGRTSAEKAGARQELMGIQRYQDYNTAENKFLIYFAQKVLRLECTLYLSNNEQYRGSVSQFRELIDRFLQQPEVLSIQARQYHPTRPNYVLQQNPIYSTFYRAFLYYIQHKAERAMLWSYRHSLLGDTATAFLLSALMQWQGSYVHPLEMLKSRSSPDYGRYLNSQRVPIQVYLRDRVYCFTIERSPQDDSLCDIRISLATHHLQSKTLEAPQTQELLLWLFWYRPTEAAIIQAENYLRTLSDRGNRQGRVLYLQISPQDVAHVNPACDPPWLSQLPNISTASHCLEHIETFVHLIRNWVEAAHG